MNQSLGFKSLDSKIPFLTAACFENDRNRLREFIISWFMLNSKKQSWYR